VPNKANCPKRGTEAVSQLQISDCGLGIEASPAAGRPDPRGLVVQTNPICTRREESVGQAPPHTWLNCAKQTQFGSVCATDGSSNGETCETNPIPATGNKRQRLDGKGVMVNSTSDRPCQNKANSAGWDTPGGTTSGAVAWARCAKQTQFGPEGLAGRGTNKANPARWPIVSNKPNCPKRGTEAVSGCTGWTMPGRRGRGGNRAKQSQFGATRARMPKPRRDDCARQSQTWAPWGICGTAHGGACCAKRTQSARRGRAALPRQAEKSQHLALAARYNIPPTLVHDSRSTDGGVRNVARA
jgi:hypothetical protein